MTPAKLFLVFFLCHLYSTWAWVIEAEAELIVRQHNDVRAAAGSLPLVWDGALAEVASTYVNACASFSHSSKQ